MPNVDLNDANLDGAIHQRRQEINPPQKPASSSIPESGQGAEASEQDAHLRSMIASTGQLDLDDRGNWDFHGGSSGTVFMRRMREQFGGLFGEPGAPFLPRIPRQTAMAMFESPRSATESPFDSGLPNTLELPPKDVAKTLCNNTLNSACALFRFMHQPTFYEMFDRIYDIPADNFGDDENRFLPLLYIVLALGSMFSTEPLDEQPATDPKYGSYKASLEEG